jgi:hypothetical protein
MATINFLYRSTKEKANLHLRLLYRYNEKDFVFGANTKYEVSKLYWSKEHKQQKFKKTIDIDELNKIQKLKEKQNEVTAELNKIENHILNAFNSVNPGDVSKKWLLAEISNYYNPPKVAEALPTGLIKYLECFLEKKKSEHTERTQKNYNVVKQLLIRYETYSKKTISINEINENFKLNFEQYCNAQGYAKNTLAKAFS